jgi:hypothetical protein
LDVRVEYITWAVDIEQTCHCNNAAYDKHHNEKVRDAA